MDSRKYIPCRNYGTGYCKLEEECPYMHDKIPLGYRPKLSRKPKKYIIPLCKYFLDGFCKQGDQCKFPHVYDTHESRCPSPLPKRDKRRNLSKERVIPRTPAPYPGRFGERVTIRGSEHGPVRMPQSLERNKVRSSERTPMRMPDSMTRQSSERIQIRGSDQSFLRVPEMTSESTVNNQTQGFDRLLESLQTPAHLLPFKYNCETCQALPKVYGLLLRCNHSFCLDCLRKRRNSFQTKNGIFISQKGIHCPICNAFSASIIPSPFPFPNGGFDKLQAIENQLLKLNKVVCKHFMFSLQRTSRYCPYKDDCLRAHPLDGKDLSQVYIFEPRKTNFLTNQNSMDPYEVLVQKIEVQSKSWEDFIEKTGDTDSEGEDSLIFVDKNEPFYGYDSDDVMNNPSKEIFIGNALLGVHRIDLPSKPYINKQK